jgi:hypothetical protein
MLAFLSFGSRFAVAQTPETRRLLAELRAAPLIVSSARGTVALRAHPNRDFMPGPGNSSKLRIFFSLIPDSASRLSNDLIPERIYVVLGTQVWSGAVAIGVIRRTSREISGVVWDGPFWPVGDSVEVVLRYRTRNGKGLVRAARTSIGESS